MEVIFKHYSTSNKEMQQFFHNSKYMQQILRLLYSLPRFGFRRKIVTT